MKKSLMIMAAIIFPLLFSVSCNNDTPSADEYEIGDRGPAGGWIFYINGNYEKGSTDRAKNWHYLEAASIDLENKQVWGKNGIIGNKAGLENGSFNMSNFSRNGLHFFPAAMACFEYREGGCSDWFLPTKEQLFKMFENLKQKGTGGTWEDGPYWSSTENENNDHSAYSWFFGGNGNQSTPERDESCYIRPVRAFE